MLPETLNTDDDPSRDIAISIQKFSSSLYPVMAKEKKLLFSPFSIYFQLILLYLGAVDDTAVEMRGYLHLPFCRERLLMGMRKVLRKLKQSSIKIMMEMFVHHTYKIRAKFRGDAMKFLFCNVRYLDFAAPQETTRLINSWAASNSNQKISNLIPPGVIDEFLEFVVLGAFCLERNWLNEFEVERTSKDVFLVDEDDPAEVEMMHISGQFYYLRKATFKALVLPCKDEKLKLVIVLPQQIEHLTYLEEKISELDVMRILQDAKMKEIDVTLPKFRRERLNHKIHMQLRKAGLKIIFDPKKANFTEIHKLGQELVCVDYIKQKVMIEINERGIEIIVQLDGIEDKPPSPARRRVSDSELIREVTEKVAKISEDSVISREQPKKQEKATSEEAMVSELVAISSSSFDETKNYSEDDQEEDKFSGGIENISEELQPSAESCHKEIASKVEIGTIPKNNTEAIVPVENEEVFRNVGATPEVNCSETETETHVRESSLKLSDRHLEDGEERISTTELMEVDFEKTESVLQSMVKQKLMIEVSEKENGVIVQLEGLEKKTTSSARKRGADSKPILKKTEKVAKISKDGVIPCPQPDEEEVTTSEEATVSELVAKESEKSTVTVPNFRFNEAKNYSENDQEEMKDYSSVMLKQSIPERRDNFREIENNSKKSQPSAEYYRRKTANQVEIETIPENNTEAIARVGNGEVFKNVRALPEVNCSETETETHVGDRSSKSSDRRLENGEERILTIEQMEIEVVDSVIVEETGIVKSAIPTVSECNVQEPNYVKSHIHQMEIIEQKFEDTPAILESHYEETKGALSVVIDNSELVPELVERMDEVEIEDCRAETETIYGPSTSKVFKSHDEEIEVLQHVVEKVSEGRKSEAEITTEDTGDQNESNSSEEADVLWQDFTGTSGEPDSHFTANHPFIYYVLHDCSILVIGKYLDLE